MKRRLLIAAALLATAACVTPATATASRYYAYTCSNDTVLRVVFDDEHNTAVVNRIRQPSIRLTKADGDFHYTRGDRYELRGSAEQVQWRVGRAQWTCGRGGG